MSTAPNVAKLATAFIRRMRMEVGLKAIREINARNRTPAYARACATHDYCDANVVMAAAFTEVMGRPTDLHSDEDLKLWNAAWDLARARAFQL